MPTEPLYVLLIGSDSRKGTALYTGKSNEHAQVNQHSDINATHELLQDESKCEFIVTSEVREMSRALPFWRRADIDAETCTWLPR